MLLFERFEIQIIVYIMGSNFVIAVTFQNYIIYVHMKHVKYVYFVIIDNIHTQKSWVLHKTKFSDEYRSPSNIDQIAHDRRKIRVS